MQSRKFLFVILILAVCITQFAADIYSPCLSAISSAFGTPVRYAQWSMSIYMLGVAVTQLVYGPVSEGVGRKLPISFGLLLMTLGSFVCVLANSINILIVGRLLQGCGAGACACLWRSVFRDIFTGEDLARYGSYLVIFIMWIVPTAPLLGGYLQDFYGWKANFIFMAFYALLAWIGIHYGFQETNPHHHISKLSLNIIVNHYSTLLKSPLFMGVACATFLSYGAFFSWFVIGPVLLIDRLGISASDFGWITALAGGGAYALAGFLNGRWVKFFGMTFMLRLGWGIMATASLVMMFGHWVLEMNVWSLMFPVVLFYFGSTFIWPNAFAMAFTPFGEIAGYAGALYGFMQICGAAVISALVAYLPNSNPMIFGLVMLFSSLTAWGVFETISVNARVFKLKRL